MLRTLPLLLLLFFAAALPSALATPAASVSAPPIDLLPLKKALAPLGGSGVLQSHSTIRMTGTQRGISVVLREDLQIVSRRPGRFHALLTQFASALGPQTKLEVVSDGASVWTYRPGLRRYSVMTLAAFKTADSDVPTLGLVIGGFYLGEGRPLVEGFGSITAANSAEVLSALSAMDVAITREAKSVASQDDYVYTLTLAKQNLVYKFYVATQTNALTRVDLAGTEGSLRVTYREDIDSITPQPATPSSAFTFTPPPGTAKVPAVSINPY